jgi:hypothetical protein
VCTKIAQAQTAKYIFLKLPIKASDNRELNFVKSLQTLKANMSVLWRDIYSYEIHRSGGKKGTRPVYTILAARLKVPEAHAPAAQANTPSGTPQLLQPVNLLLTQLHACHFLHENTQ